MAFLYVNVILNLLIQQKYVRCSLKCDLYTSYEYVNIVINMNIVTKLSLCIVKLSQGYITLRLEITHIVIASKSNYFYR